VKVVDGYHQISVPMVSRQVSCRFMLQPYANTLGDFFNSILEEDKAIQQVHAENEGNSLCYLQTAKQFCLSVHMLTNAMATCEIKLF